MINHMRTPGVMPSMTPVSGIKAWGGGDPGKGVGGGSVAGGLRVGFGVGGGLSSGGGAVKVAVGVLVAVGVIGVGVGVSVGNGVAVGIASWRTTRPTFSEPGSPLAVKLTL